MLKKNEGILLAALVALVIPISAAMGWNEPRPYEVSHPSRAALPPPPPPAVASFELIEPAVFSSEVEYVPQHEDVKAMIDEVEAQRIVWSGTARELMHRAIKAARADNEDEARSLLSAALTFANRAVDTYLIQKIKREQAALNR